MKIAITSTENKLEAKLDSRFGRCSYFAIYNVETNSTEFLENPNKDATGGAGPASAQFIAKEGVTQVISGEFGGKAKSIMESLEIQMIMINDKDKTIQDILNTINKN